jgi:hypothetical protein
MVNWNRRRANALAAVVACALTLVGGAAALPAKSAGSGPDAAWAAAVRDGKTIPAGYRLRAVPEAPQRAALAPTSAFDPNRASDKFAQFQQAAALPLANGNLHWQDVGPKGVDNPPGYSGSTEQFMKVAGMGAALASDTNDRTGNTVYFGNMGGLWKSTDAGANWRNLSDGKIASAGVGAIGLDPARPNDIYVGTGITYLTLSGDTYGTGFYVSHDGGATFSRPSPNVSGWAVTVIKVTPTAVFVGTNHGLYRSTDHGDSLALVNLPDNATHTGPATGPYANWITDIAVRPGHSNEITAAVGFYQGKATLADGSVASPGNGLYRSTTGGAPGSFTAMDVSGWNQQIDPQRSSDQVGRISLAYGQTEADDGVLWAFVSDAGLAAGKGDLGDQVPNRTGAQLNGLFRSPDDGATWAPKVLPTSLATASNSTLTGELPLGYAPGVQASYELWVQTDPNVADQVYFGLEEAYQTIANAGATPGLAAVDVIERYADLCGFYLFFTNTTNGVSCPSQVPLYGGLTTHPDQHAAIMIRTPNGSRMYSANDGGVFHQDGHTVATGGRYDNDSWTDMNTLPSLEPWHVAMLPSGEVLAGLQDNGTSLNGPDRKGVQIGLGDGFWVIPTADSNVFYVGIAGGALFITKDHGHNLQEIQPNLTAPTFTSPIAVDPTDPNHLIAAAQNVEESMKGASTSTVSDPVAGTIISTDWTQSFDAGTSPTTDSISKKVQPWEATALDVRGAPAYAALCASCKALYENFGDVHAKIETNVKAGCTAHKGAADCWHIATSAGLPPGWVQSVRIDPADSRTVYASIIERQFVGYPANDVPGRVFVSHDGAESFTDITGNLPHGSVWALVQHGGQLIAATDTGMFTSVRGTSTWSRLGTGLPAVQVRDAWLDPTGQFLLVSAYGRGVWKLDFGTPSTGGTNSPGPQVGSGLPNTAVAAISLGAPLGAGVVLAVVLVTARLLRRRKARLV